MRSPFCLNCCGGNHLGQRSCASAQTGRTYGRKRADQNTAIHLARRGPSTYEENRRHPRRWRALGPFFSSSFEVGKAVVAEIPIRLRCVALVTAFCRRRSNALAVQLLDPRADRSKIVGGARLGHASSMPEITTGKIVPWGDPANPASRSPFQTKRAGRRDSARLGVTSWYDLSTEGSARRR